MTKYGNAQGGEYSTYALHMKPNKRRTITGDGSEFRYVEIAMKGNLVHPLTPLLEKMEKAWAQTETEGEEAKAEEDRSHLGLVRLLA